MAKESDWRSSPHLAGDGRSKGREEPDGARQTGVQRDVEEAATRAEPHRSWPYRPRYSKDIQHHNQHNHRPMWMVEQREDHHRHHAKARQNNRRGSQYRVHATIERMRPTVLGAGFRCTHCLYCIGSASSHLLRHIK